MKLVFMGTPDFAVPALRRLCDEGLVPARVYSQPARGAGRGRRALPPPVAREATARGLALRQPETLQTRAELQLLAELEPDLIVTVAYGKIFRRRLLELPRLGCINLHPSLLPRYRGLAPIAWAILRGEVETGVTVYRMEQGVDAGPILLQEVVPIQATDTAATLGARLAERGANLVVRALRGLADDSLRAAPQDEARASFAPRLTREHGLLDWRLPAAQIVRMVRAFEPWPGTYAFNAARRLKVLEAAAIDEMPHCEPPGTVIQADGRRPPYVAARPGAVALLRVQPENGRPQEGAALVRGRGLAAGDRLTARRGAGGNSHG